MRKRVAMAIRLVRCSNRIRKCCGPVTKMLCGIRLLLMPDLSTSAESVGRFCVLFLLAVRPLRASFPLSDDRDVDTPGPEGGLQDQPEKNGQARRMRGTPTRHGTRPPQH